MRTLRALTLASVLIAVGGCNQQVTEPPGNEPSPPALSDIADQRTPMGEGIEIEFSVSHEEPDELDLSVTSGDADLIPDHRLAISGSGNSRLLTALPSPTGIGSAEISLTAVADDGGQDEKSFLLETLRPYSLLQWAVARPEGTDLDYEGDLAVNDRFAFVGSWRLRYVHVFERDGDGWHYFQTLRPSDVDTTVGSLFGRSIDVDGEYAVVGAQSHDELGQNAGAAYVFHYDGTQWSEVAKLLPPDAPASEFGSMGTSVAISGDHVIVGAAQDNGSGGGISTGSAYVFQRSGTTWSLTAKLTAPLPEDFDQFGSSVDISGSLAVVTIPWGFLVGRRLGVAHVFEGSGNDWTHVAELTPIEPDPDDGYGQTAALSDGTVVVGASYPNTRGDTPGPGSVYVFERAGSSYSGVTRIVPSDSLPDDGFGTDLSIHGDFLVASAPRREEPAVYVFKRVEGNWIETTRITPPGTHAASDFARVIDLAQDHLAILAQEDADDEEPLLIHDR